MTRIRGWWVGLVGFLMIAGALGGCAGGDHDDGHHDSGGCVLFGEVEPNDTELTAQFLGDMFLDDCFLIDGSIFVALDVDSYRVLVQEDLTLVVTIDHSPLVDFDILIFDCGVAGVPEVCVVSFVVRSHDIAVDVVVAPCQVPLF